MAKRECPECGGGVMHGKYDDNDNPIWDCVNCSHKMKRRVLNTKKRKERAKNKPKLDKIFNDLLNGKYK